jgi:hypothetical protein
VKSLKKEPLVFNTNTVMQRSIFTYLKVQHTFLIKHFNIKKVNDHIFEKGAQFLIKILNKNVDMHMFEGDKIFNKNFEQAF